MDLRGLYLGEGYSLALLCAQTAVYKLLEVALLRHRDRAGQPEKWTISGHATPEFVRYFMAEWAPTQFSVEVKIYGSEERGYAGVYIP